jgi:hypothetical protein
MSQDFNPVLVKDSRLNVTDSIDFAVLKGGQNVSQQVYNAINPNSSSIVFNCPVPSEQTLIDRRILLKSQVVLQVTVPNLGTGAGGADTFFQYGLNSALAPFPQHQMFSTMTSTINNASISVNTSDVLAPLLRMTDSEQLQRYNGTTPVAYDTYYKYSDLVGTPANVLGDWASHTDNDLVQRGSWSIDSISVNADGTGGLPKYLDGNGAPANIVFYVKFTTTEPLMMPPFLWGNSQTNNQAMYGIQQMNFQFNIGSGSRAIRTAVAGASAVVSSVVYSQLLINLLSSHPSDLFSSRNVVPAYSFNRYITAQSGTLANGASSTYTTNALQLNSIPSKLVLFVRDANQKSSSSASDSWLVIKKCAITFNNQAGLLSNATAEQLFEYSVQSGSNQSWSEFGGKVNLWDATAKAPKNIATSGSLLMLNFGEHVGICEDFLAPNSIGTYNISVQLEVFNQTGASITNPEILMICINDGVLVNEKGTSSYYEGLLTKQAVLDASTQKPRHKSEVEHMIGSGFLDSLKSVAGKVGQHLPKVKEILKHSGNKHAEKASEALESLGYGKHRLTHRIM